MPWVQVARLTKPKACVSCFLCESACDKGAIGLEVPEASRLPPRPASKKPKELRATLDNRARRISGGAQCV